MDGLGIIRAALRHPWVIAICLVLTVISSAAVFLLAPKSYSANAQVILLGSNVSLDANGKPVAVNPLSQAGDNAAQVAASALVVISETDSFANALKATGASSSYSVSVSGSGGGVVLIVSTTSKQAAAATHDLPLVVKQLSAALKDQQDKLGAPADTYMSLSGFTGEGAASPASGGRSKLTAVAGILGLLISLMAGVVADARKRSAGRRVSRGRSRDRSDEQRAQADEAGRDRLVELEPRLRPAPDSDTERGEAIRAAASRDRRSSQGIRRHERSAHLD